MDYSVFNDFLRSCNWSLFHLVDKQKFYKALGKIIHDRDFSIADLECYLKDYIEKHCNDRKLYNFSMMEQRIPQLIRDVEIITAYLSRNDY